MKGLLPPDPELLALIDEAGAFAAPGTVAWRDAWGSYGTVATRGTFGNTVSRIRVPRDDLPRFLADVARRYRVRPAFHVGPFETPGLAAALLAEGYRLAERDGILVHDLDPDLIPDASGVQVCEARDTDDFLAENWLSGVVFGDPPIRREAARKAAEQAARPDVATSTTFVVRDPEGRLPCLASAGMAFHGSWAFLVSGQTHPAARGQGLYRALVGARLDLASGLGLAFAATEADAAMSLPILTRWGFRCLGWKEIYRWPGTSRTVRGGAGESRGAGPGDR